MLASVPVLPALSLWLTLVAATTPADLGPVAPGTLRAYVVRHGQAYSNLNPQPPLSPEELDRLTPLGVEQARRTAESLKASAIDLIVASPRRRTLQTAEEMSRVLGGIEVRVDERLRPLEMGRADGRELEWNDRYSDWEFGRDPAPPGGESLDTLGLRVFEVMRNLRRTEAGRSVVLVSHSEVISNIVGYLTGATLTGRFAIRIANGSITVAEWPNAALPRVLLTNFVVPQPAPSTPAPGAAGAGAARPPARRPPAR